MSMSQEIVGRRAIVRLINNLPRTERGDGDIQKLLYVSYNYINIDLNIEET